jgi:hypothetical protein
VIKRDRQRNRGSSPGRGHGGRGERAETRVATYLCALVNQSASRQKSLTRDTHSRVFAFAKWIYEIAMYRYMMRRDQGRWNKYRYEAMRWDDRRTQRPKLSPEDTGTVGSKPDISERKTRSPRWPFDHELTTCRGSPAIEQAGPLLPAWSLPPCYALLASTTSPSGPHWRTAAPARPRSRQRRALPC